MRRVAQSTRVASMFPVVLTAFVALSSGCSLEGLQFKQDERIQIVSPRYREKVEMPVTLDWELNGLVMGQPTEEGTPTHFAVYVDVDPQPSGEDLAYFSRDDLSCREEDGCPDAQYLEDIGVHTTTATEMVFSFLPLAPGVDLDLGNPDVHELTLVLLDAQGRRVGESAWSQTFEILR